MREHSHSFFAVLQSSILTRPVHSAIRDSSGKVLLLLEIELCLCMLFILRPVYWFWLEHLRFVVLVIDAKKTDRSNNVKLEIILLASSATKIG